MEKNIFENAYFGKAYKTRDGRKAIFFQFDTIMDDNCNAIGHLAYVYTLKDGEYTVAQNGISTSENDIILHNVNTIELDEDIVSEWQEPIDEFKLDELAEEHATKYAIPHTSQFVDMTNGYKAGYRKALKQ